MTTTTTSDHTLLRQFMTLAVGYRVQGARCTTINPRYPSYEVTRGPFVLRAPEGGGITAHVTVREPGSDNPLLIDVLVWDSTHGYAVEGPWEQHLPMVVEAFLEEVRTAARAEVERREAVQRQHQQRSEALIGAARRAVTEAMEGE